jgi:hypothetical protein
VPAWAKVAGIPRAGIRRNGRNFFMAGSPRGLLENLCPIDAATIADRTNAYLGVSWIKDIPSVSG